MNARIKGSGPVVLLFVGLFIVSPLLAQTQSSRTVETTVGDTFTIDQSISSTFHRWKVERYDVRKLSLRKKVRPDTIGRFRFTFQALEAGDATIDLSRYLRTALTEEVREEHTVNVRVRTEESEREVESERSPRTSASPAESQPTPEATQSTARTRSRGNPRERAAELLEIGQYEQAREFMRERMKSGPASARSDWLERIARSYREQEQYAAAIDVWNRLINEFPQGPQARWLLELARDHRANDADDKAQLALLEIRHRFKGSPQWPEAMEMLADIALATNNIERARTILERALSVLPGSQNPRLTLRLARLYDEYAPVRDYRRAVKLYRKAARQLQESDSEAARNARKRADYLMQNYVKFGTE